LPGKGSGKEGAPVFELPEALPHFGGIMRVLIILLALGITIGSSLVWSADPKQSDQVFSGTVEAMDAAQGKITVKNDLGHDIPLQLLNPDLLKGIAVGDRVSVQLEKPGVAKKITKLTVPELPAPLGTGK
jgi:hypothetical protein